MTNWEDEQVPWWKALGWVVVGLAFVAVTIALTGVALLQVMGVLPW